MESSVTTGSLFEKLSRYLIPILLMTQGKSGLYAKNSSKFKTKKKTGVLKEMK